MNSKCCKLSVPYTTAQKLLTEGFAAMTHFQGSCFLLSRILGWPKGRKDAKLIKYKFLSVRPLPASPEVTHWLETPHWFSAGQKWRGKSRIRFLCSFGATCICTSPNHPPASMAVPYFLDFPPKTRSPLGNGDRTEQLQEWTGISEPVLQGMLLQSLEWFWRVEGPCGGHLVQAVTQGEWPGLCPDGFWILPRMESPKPPQATHASAQSPSASCCP